MGADVVVMLHPDYQYSPRLLVAMASMIASGHFDVVLGSRILGGSALCAGDAAVQICDEPDADADAESFSGPETFGISHGLSGVQP